MKTELLKAIDQEIENESDVSVKILWGDFRKFVEDFKPKTKKKPLEGRKKDFIDKLEPFIEKYGRATLNEFFSYWTEHNDRGSKMRFEMAKNQPFNINRRLVTWEKRNKDGKSTSKTDTATSWFNQ